MNIELISQQRVNDPDNDILRQQYYMSLLASDLHIALLNEPNEGNFNPLTVSEADLGFALVFHDDNQLSEFSREPMPFLQLEGRLLVKLLIENNIGMGLNLGNEAQSLLLTPSDLQWMLDAQDLMINTAEPELHRIYSPINLPKNFMEEVGNWIHENGLPAEHVLLVGAKTKSGKDTYILGLVNLEDEMVLDAKRRFLPYMMDGENAFTLFALNSDDANFKTFQRHGIWFEILEDKTAGKQIIPGSDPNKPPKLR